MEQFSLEKWLQDKSRKVVTREGEDVEIIHTNSPVPHHPIVGFIDKSIYTWTIDGKLIYGKKEQDKNDLFFADEEDELTEFEKALSDIIGFWQQGYHVSKDIKIDAKYLLALARKELEKSNVIVDKDSYIKNCDYYYQHGKQYALRSLPKWKKSTENKDFGIDEVCILDDDIYPTLVTNVNVGDYYLELDELKNLPLEE